MDTSQELVRLNLPSLLAESQQLKIMMEIDRDLLTAELDPLVTGLATLELSVRSLQVTSDETNEQCCDILNKAAERKKALTAIWSRYKTPLNAARATVLDLEKKTVGVAEDIRAKAAAKSAAFMREKQRAAASINRRFEQVADQSRSTLAGEAQELLISGDARGYRAKMAEVGMIATPVLPMEATAAPASVRSTPKVKGSVSDIMAILKAIVDGKIPLVHTVKPGDDRPLVAIDQVVLNAIVNRQGLGTNIPGVTVEEEFQVGAKGVR